MISRINSIQNVGQFERFCGTENFDSNIMIFGFNGAGKSTLSDIFYSLSMEKKESILLKRRTLNREGENTLKKMKILLETDSGNQISFENEAWSNIPNNLFVFNTQYINDHVFVSKRLYGNIVPIGIGSEGTNAMKKRERIIIENAQLIAEMNKNIKTLSEKGMKIKDFSAAKVSERTPIKRFEKMMSFQLFPTTEKKIIEGKMKNKTKYSNELKDMDLCNEMYEEIKNVAPFSKALLVKTVNKTPRVTSRELSSFLSETMTISDIRWAVAGYKNQKDRSICPMCGQNLSEKRAVVLFEKLGEYVIQNRGGNIRIFCDKLRFLASQLQLLELKSKVKIFVEIINKLKANGLLLKKEMVRLEKGLLWNDFQDEMLNSIVKKIYQKVDNPYIDINLSAEENDCIILANNVVKNINNLGKILIQVRERLDKKIDKNLSMDDMWKIFELSYGVYRSEAENIRNSSVTYYKNNKKLAELNQKIDDCYNQSRLNDVNDYLAKMNTNIKIEVNQSRYYIRLKDFKAREYEKDNETIFSEGEQRAIAFAYFLAELKGLDPTFIKKIIVIDDPISSMDLSRKSIISHQVAEIMNNNELQVIVMTHDISFVERVNEFLDSKTSCKLLELRSGKTDFIPLVIKDYLTDDEHVYEEFIKDAEKSSDAFSKIIAFMSLRPYAYVKKVSEEDYNKIEKMSTYFAHTKYSYNNRVMYKETDYNNIRLKEYVQLVSSMTAIDVDKEKLVETYSFQGFDFDSIVNLYLSISIDSMKSVRKKALLMRPLIEACFFQLSSKNKFDPEHIGKMYKNTISANRDDPERKEICRELKELYDGSKKYHHGADDGSLLGISWINPNEIVFFDERMRHIISMIREKGILRTLSA